MVRKSLRNQSLTTARYLSVQSLWGRLFAAVIPQVRGEFGDKGGTYTLKLISGRRPVGVSVSDQIAEELRGGELLVFDGEKYIDLEKSLQPTDAPAYAASFYGSNRKLDDGISHTYFHPNTNSVQAIQCFRLSLSDDKPIMQKPIETLLEY